MKVIIEFFTITCFILVPSISMGLTVQQKDDFQDANQDTMGWAGGASPIRVSSGGPDGSGDAFLLISVGNFHLATKNEAQWTGDYLAAGVQAIAMDLNRILGPDEVQIRLFVHGPGGRFGSTNPTLPLPLDSWGHYVFGLTASDLTYVSGGTGVLEDTLRNVTTLLIRNDPGEYPTDIGSHYPHITATLGIDNIAGICQSAPISDLNGDCRSDLLDFAIFAANWLIDCNYEPSDPGCISQ